MKWFLNSLNHRMEPADFKALKQLLKRAEVSAHDSSSCNSQNAVERLIAETEIVIKLSGGDLTQQDVELLARLDGLVELDLRHNDIVFMPDFSCLTALRTLRLEPRGHSVECASFPPNSTVHFDGDWNQVNYQSLIVDMVARHSTGKPLPQIWFGNSRMTPSQMDEIMVQFGWTGQDPIATDSDGANLGDFPGGAQPYPAYRSEGSEGSVTSWTSVRGEGDSGTELEPDGVLGNAESRPRDLVGRAQDQASTQPALRLLGSAALNNLDRLMLSRRGAYLQGVDSGQYRDRNESNESSGGSRSSENSTGTSFVPASDVGFDSDSDSSSESSRSSENSTDTHFVSASDVGFDSDSDSDSDNEGRVRNYPVTTTGSWSSLSQDRPRPPQLVSGPSVAGNAGRS